MSSLSRKDALLLIRMTIFEFHRDVMLPLDDSIRQRPSGDGQTNAEMLNSQFRAFSQGVNNLNGSVTDAIEGLDNFRLSQLLSLCRDISELYNLSVLAKMPSFIADDNLLDADPEDPAPLRYVAPGVTLGVFRRRTRDRPHRDAELAFTREVLGPIGERAYKNSIIQRQGRLAGSMGSGLSIPFFGVGIIRLEGREYENPMNTDWGRNLFIHELFHQVQYLQGVPLARLASEVIRHDRTPARLWNAQYNAREAAAYAVEHAAGREQRIANGITDPAADRAAARAERAVEHADRRVERAEARVERNAARANPRPNVYSFEPYLYRDTLNDLPHYEAQAQLVGDFAQYYYTASRRGQHLLNINERTIVIEAARILENSEFITEATRWVNARVRSTTR